MNVYRHKFNALVHYVTPDIAHFSAIKTAERITCINREEVFE